MPTNTFSIGLDCQLVVIAPTGQELQLSIVTGFDAKQDVKSVRVQPLNGPPQGANLPGGWNGTFHLARGSSAVDDLFSQMEQGYWAGGIVGTGEIYQYVTETNGSQSTYLFSGVTMHLSEAGSWKQDAEVAETIEFFASTRKRV